MREPLRNRAIPKIQTQTDPATTWEVDERKAQSALRKSRTLFDASGGESLIVGSFHSLTF